MEHNLISQKDIDLIKTKLRKSHRNTSDWVVIKDILTTHSVIVAEPVEEDPRLQVFEHILCVDKSLYAFTNRQSCEEFLKDLNIRLGTPERLFRMGSMPFLEAVDISDINHLDLNIDWVGEKRFIVYVPEEMVLKVRMMVKA